MNHEDKIAELQEEVKWLRVDRDNWRGLSHSDEAKVMALRKELSELKEIHEKAEEERDARERHSTKMFRTAFGLLSDVAYAKYLNRMWNQPDPETTREGSVVPKDVEAARRVVKKFPEWEE
jgi:hypothetical protein